MNPRRRILDAVIEIAVREGYDHTCVDRTCSAAKVPPPVFDEHFESIQDCFLQASDELIGQLELAVLKPLYEEAPWPERIRRGLQRLLAVISEHPDRARFTMIECPRVGEGKGKGEDEGEKRGGEGEGEGEGALGALDRSGALDRLHSAQRVFVPVLEEGMEYAVSIEHRSVAHLSPLTAEGIVGGIAAIIHKRVLEENTAELPGLLPDLLYFALMPYLGHDRALAAA
jgi:AcrR family transcriptional regulator